jgi:hypothetical protein
VYSLKNISPPLGEKEYRLMSSRGNKIFNKKNKREKMFLKKKKKERWK